MKEPTLEPSSSRALSQELCRHLLARCELSGQPLVHVRSGTWLLRAGDVLRALPAIESGRLDAVMSLQGDGSQVIPVSFGAGELALLSTLFDRAPPRANIVAAEPVRMRWIPVETIERTLLDDKTLLLLLVRFLSQRLREVRLRERGWLERGVPERVKMSLARIALEQTSASGRPWLIHATHEHLALRCGVSRPKLSQELKRLERTGAIQLHRGAVEILDYSKLGTDDRLPLG